jgi:hypothetical protein
VTTHRELRDVPDSLLRRKPTPAGEMTRQRKLLAWLERSNIRVSLLDVDLERQRRTNTVPAGPRGQSAAPRRRTSTTSSEGAQP